MEKCIGVQPRQLSATPIDSGKVRGNVPPHYFRLAKVLTDTLNDDYLAMIFSGTGMYAFTFSPFRILSAISIPKEPIMSGC